MTVSRFRYQAKWSHRTLVIPAGLDAEYNFSKVREAGLQLATLSDVHLQDKLNESRSQPQGGDHVCAGRVKDTSKGWWG